VLRAQGEPLEPQTLEALGAMLLGSGEDVTYVYGGELGSLHRALLRTLCDAEEKTLFDIDDARMLLPLPAAVDDDEQGAGGSGSGTTHEVVESDYAARAPIDSGVVWRFKDAAKMLDALSWEEVLRRIIILWQVGTRKRSQTTH
jgi:hypothetical protein